MLLFDNKLMKEKKDEEDSLEDQRSSDEIGSSMVEAQKSAIVSLSKQEKLLLLELQRTRMSIVDELEQLDPQISAENWKDVQSTIASYQEKIVSLASEETMDGQKRGGRLELPGSPTRGHGITGMRGSPPMMKGSVETSTRDWHYESVTTPARNKAVTAAAYVPASRIRTSVDMLPVFSASTTTDIDRSIRRQADIRMPTFKLPDIDQERINQILEEKSGVPQVLKEEKVTKRDDAPKSSQGKRGFRLKLKDAMGYTEALSKALKKMGPMEASFLMQELGITHTEWGAVAEELQKRVNMKVTVDTEEVVNESTEATSVFVEAKRKMLENSFVSISADMRPGEGLEEHSVMSLENSRGRSSPSGTSPFLGSKLDAGSTISGFGSQEASMGGGGMQMSRSQPLTRMPKGRSAGSVRSTALSRKSYGSKARGSVAGMSKADRSVADSIDTSEHLRNELVSSLRSMQYHTVGVKSSIASVQSLAATGNERAKAMLFSIAAEKMQDALSLVIKGELKRGWAAWIVVDNIRRRQQCTVKLTRMLGLRMIGEALNQVVMKKLQKKFNIWVYYWKMESSRRKRELQTKASIAIQCEMRAYLARKRVRFIREQIKYRRLYAAVIKVQAQFRGRVTKWKFQKFMRGRLEERSALIVQRVFRGHRSKKRVKILKMQRDKHRSATMIQKVVRGRQGRRTYNEANFVRVQNRAAVKIQAIIRGFLARRTLSKILQNKMEAEAILIMQARWRGAICRMNMARVRKELLAYKELRYKAARDIQKVFRGYRSRLGTRIKMIEKERKMRKVNNAGTVINTWVRRFLAKRRVEERRRERTLTLLADARAWKEGWSEEAEAWFYLNENTGEDLWEPPASGYTKLDGSLVLADGTIIEDPEVLEAREIEKKKTAETLCCECDERAAIKFCRECGDKYCTPCYRNSHATGTRRKHNTDPLGPLDCNECEDVLGIRWCVSCDDCFCDDCWRKVHSHGKRRFHNFYEVSTKGKLGDRLLTIDGTEQPAYDATYPTQMQEAEYEQDQYADASAEYAQLSAQQNEFAAQWQEFQDDDGYPYWYNESTGESTYQNPFEVAEDAYY